MSIETVGQSLAVAVALLALIQASQAIYSYYRRRDDSLVTWGGEVIVLISDMERLFSGNIDKKKLKENAFDYSIRAGVLLDRGRLFFSNVKSSDNFTGYRVKILDEIVKASYIASAIAYERVELSDELRLKLWACRKNFVRLLQREMGWALRRRGKTHMGDSISHDPREWPDVTAKGWWQA